MDKYRKAIEIQKMIEEFNENGYAVRLHYFDKKCSVKFNNSSVEPTFNLDDLYDFLKAEYYRLVKHQRTEIIDLDLDLETTRKLYEQADKEGKLVDEYISQALEQHLNEMKDLDEEILMKEEELAHLKSKRKKMEF